MSDSQPAPLFTMREGLFMPEPISGSPWHDDAVNGAAVSALLGHLIDVEIDQDAMGVARLVVDILGRVPFRPLEGRVTVTRPGKRLSMVVAELVADGRVVASATAMLMRRADTPAVNLPPKYVMPDDDAAILPFSQRPFGQRLRSRRLYGVPHEPGNGALWANAELIVLPGVPLTPLVRVALLADTASGVGSALDRTAWTYANVDIVVHFLRMPRGPWIRIESATESAGNGQALARAQFADGDGLFAHGVQHLFVAPI